MSTVARRRVFLTAAALGDPAVVVADGPSNGLDAQARAVLAEQFAIWSRDRVVLFASHDAELVKACGERAIKLASGLYGSGAHYDKTTASNKRHCSLLQAF